MLQAPVLNSLSFDPFSFQLDGLAPPGVDIGRAFIEAQANRRQRSSANQKPADESLFDTGARNQPDVFQRAPEHKADQKDRRLIVAGLGGRVTPVGLDLRIRFEGRDCGARLLGNAEVAQAFVSWQ